ncbi:DinB family protein [Salirhabdus salicampi]|uniref:DinB family protein n=1 Tax=Salirhabdus salicampi TaxID=476102 RepID=UPI0020C2B8F6|nr:DinB family protein [Salirhabdus salicampi]MCP8615868.1 DinB family protein [Salirhabdus salicampi]
MNHYLFDQLEHVRGITLKVLERVNEEDADVVHDGFRNSIRWNVGHIYLVQEQLAFGPIGLSQHIPHDYSSLFSPGTSPKDWELEVPTLNELRGLLQEQPKRVKQQLSYRLDEEVTRPHTTKSGIHLETVAEFLSFSLFHEGIHMNTIVNYHKLNKYKQK